MLSNDPSKEIHKNFVVYIGSVQNLQIMNGQEMFIILIFRCETLLTINNLCDIAIQSSKIILSWHAQHCVSLWEQNDFW